MGVEPASGLDVSIFEAVLACGQTEAKVALVRQLVGLFADPEASVLEKDQVLPILVKAASDDDIVVRQVLAEELLTVENLHPDLFFAIVADEESVSIPFLSNLPAISSWHMLTILRVGDDPRQQVIAERPDLTADARAYIVKAGGIAAVCAMLGNPAVTLSAAELRSLYARLGQSEAVVERLLALASLPADIRIRQAKKTAIRMRQLLAERGWLAANDAADLVADAEELAVLRVISATKGAEQQEAMAYLAQNSMLTPSLVMRAACLGDLSALAAAISHLSGQATSRVIDFMLARGGSGIRSLVNRTGLPTSCHLLISAAADVLCEYRNLDVVPEPESYGRRLLEVLMMQFGALPVKDQARQIELVGRFADERVRKIARQIKIDMLRAA
jgi:uncharacterized protein (DUF2336 family)